MLIRDPRPDDEANWRKLWLGYTRFYQTDVPDAVTAATWGRVLDPKFAMFARLAERTESWSAFASACLMMEPGVWGRFAILRICLSRRRRERAASAAR